MTTNKLLNLTDQLLEEMLCPSPITPDAWSFSGQELREAIRGDRLLNVSIDLSSECNLNCPYCYTASANSAKREKKECLSFEEYKEIIIQLKEAGTKTVNIVGEGEPTMYQHFDELVEFISLHGMKVLLATNGILLSTNNKLINLLDEVKATIVLKVNSLNPELQDLLVGRKGYASLRDKALQNLINKGFNSGNPTRLAIDTLLVKPIYDELYDLFLYCRENNIALIASVYMPTGRTSGFEFHGQSALSKRSINLDELYKPMDQKDIDELLNLMKRYDAEHGISRAAIPAYISGISCTQLLGVQIDNQGKVWCCPARKLLRNNGDEISKNLAEDTKSLNSLWSNNEFLSRMRTNYNGECIFKQPYQKF